MKNILVKFVKDMTAGDLYSVGHNDAEPAIAYKSIQDNNKVIIPVDTIATVLSYKMNHWVTVHPEMSPYMEVMVPPNSVELIEG